MLVTESLCKSYHGKTVVKNLKLHIAPGEIYGFLGPNGAGKSTTIGMILGIIPATAGTVRLFGRTLGEDPIGIKRRIGVVGEVQHCYAEMTGYEYLSFFAGLFGVAERRRRIWELLDRLGLAGDGRLPVGAYSQGMQQKLGIARALVHDPEFLILDEPVSSLDPQGIKGVRDLILEENRRGKTFLVSSHLLSEVEKTCHRIGIMNRGRLLAEDTVDDIRAKLCSGAEIQVELAEELTGIAAALKTLPFVDSVTANGNLLMVGTRSGPDFRADIARFILDRGGLVTRIARRQMSLEEAFVTITENNISLLHDGREER
ncbi:ABC-2 type transport system ATP-binding protein [Hydrogenispora ethanolica]|uniref:ABC-2 type transport system ATP-binding protein n=1 Tax=Hydrogenispora ethanolica TaxID=1082276 RepID=A0A4R1SD70_HYDET|nr:ABC transporter ATP-binding protein [Hydrogenispora ethanolica]TCL76980.1 ABC-2 type transport system ATP-binding protein [Hydrogenispora ethanolica]